MDTREPPPSGDPRAAFYIDALAHLDRTRIPFLVGGAFAHARYTGIDRDTKDLDVFVLPDDVGRALALFKGAGYRVDLSHPHWLGKVYHGEYFIDLIFSGGNGIPRVDREWFAHAVEDDVLGVRRQLCPPEEMIWSKAFVQERERFDGADVLHLLRTTGPALDWQRLLSRFGEHWLVLLSHLLLFRFAYPDQRASIPSGVIRGLLARAADQHPEPDNHICYGTLLSREQYGHDLEHLGYADARLGPQGTMTRTEIQIWTDAIEEQEERSRRS